MTSNLLATAAATPDAGAPSAEPSVSPLASPMVAGYVHFPYCLEKCPYCDFVSYKTERAGIDHAAYAAAVCAELEARSGAFAGRTLGSIFFGGGTPSLWRPQSLGSVLSALRARFPPSGIPERPVTGGGELEVTVECNPTSLDRSHADALAAVGVNRLSIGVQSLDDAELKFLGRLHDANGALATLRDALASDVPRVSADLIVGLPAQTPETAAGHAIRLAELGLRHLSVYQLTIEAGTRFGELAKRGRLPMADDGRVAECFLAVHEALARFSLAHYEISNYAAAGQEARHNLAYWRGVEYVGLGTGAVGFVKNPEGLGVRYRNEIDPARYIAQSLAMPAGPPGEGDGLSSSVEHVDGETMLRERIMLGLRLASGFDLEAAARTLGVEPWPTDRKRALDLLLTRGRVRQEGPRLFIPTESWLFTDDTAARLF